MLTPQHDLYANIAPHVRGHSVLEVGFGTGTGTLQLVPYARNVTAIESDRYAVDFAREMYPMQADWQLSDILDYRVGEMFECAVMIEVLEHITNWQRALQNVRDGLVAGGELFISARNANADLRRNDLHEREWTAKEFSIALRSLFSDVTLWDYRLAKKQDETTRCTPLIARARK